MCSYLQLIIFLVVVDVPADTKISLVTLSILRYAS
jgi:hypothetical protein